jgi:molecular chaperone Hsp33
MFKLMSGPEFNSKRYRENNVSEDTLVHATAANNQIRCMAAITTNLVAEACVRHRTLPTASVALGRTLTGGLLLGGLVKDLEKITVHFDCSGPIGHMIAQADARGNVRGYVSNPDADIIRMNSQGKFDVKGVVGSGTLSVTRDAGFEIGLLKEPYHGSVPIVSGEIGEDLAFYLAKSEQVNSAVSIGVLMILDQAASEEAHMHAGDETGGTTALEDGAHVPSFSLDRLKVAAAGGYIIQMMPGADEELIEYLEQAVSLAPHSTEMIQRGLGPMEMLQAALGPVDLTVLDAINPRFHCQCSYERARLIISALGRGEIQDMLEKDNGAELRCHFCNEVYQIGAADLTAMLGEE